MEGRTDGQKFESSCILIDFSNMHVRTGTLVHILKHIRLLVISTYVRSAMYVTETPGGMTSETETETATSPRHHGSTSVMPRSQSWGSGLKTGHPSSRLATEKGARGPRPNMTPALD